MAGTGSKVDASEKGEKVPGAPAEAVRPEVRDILNQQNGQEPTAGEIRIILEEKMEAANVSHRHQMERVRRDAEADSKGNKWHKGINAQLDLFHDTGAALKRAERKLRLAYGLTIPSGEMRASFLEGGPISYDDMSAVPLAEHDAVKAALAELDNAQGLLAVRSKELIVVKNAPSAKTGYKTLDIMASTGNLAPAADKALKEAIRVVEEEDKEYKSKAAEKKTKVWGQRPQHQPAGGGWGSQSYRDQGYDRRQSDRDWVPREQSYSNNSSPAPPRSGSQNMPYGGKGGKGNGGSCNACGEFGHWAASCPGKRNREW